MSYTLKNNPTFRRLIVAAAIVLPTSLLAYDKLSTPTIADLHFPAEVAEKEVPKIDTTADLRAARGGFSTNDPTKQFYANAPKLCEENQRITCEKDSDCQHLRHYDEIRCYKPDSEFPGECRERNGISPSMLVQRASQVRQYAYQFGVTQPVARLISTVAIRESTLDPAERHRLDPDIRANIASFNRNYEVYAEAGNEYLSQQDRWFTGLGLFGQNASLHVLNWDAKAPPEVLCEPAVAVSLYLQSLRKAHDVYTGKGPRLSHRAFCDLDGDGKPERYRGESGSLPTLYDLHNYASSGKTCPLEEGAQKRVNFEIRAAHNSFDPHKPIKKSDLGYELTNSEILEFRSFGIESFVVQ